MGRPAVLGSASAEDVQARVAVRSVALPAVLLSVVEENYGSTNRSLQALENVIVSNYATMSKH